jgi:hypothetical protein
LLRSKVGEEGGFHPIATPNLATRALHRSALGMILQEAVRDRQTRPEPSFRRTCHQRFAGTLRAFGKDFCSAQKDDTVLCQGCLGHHAKRYFLSTSQGTRMSGKSVIRQKNLLSGVRKLAGAVLFLVIAEPCQAQCVALAERVPPLAVQSFTREPTSLLQQLRNEKEKLAGRLTGYLVTDPSLLPSVEKLVRQASDNDRVAIGAGLYQAESRCLPTKPEASRKINDFVRKLGDRAVLTGYAAEAEEPAGAPPQTGKPATSGSGLMTGEWGTEIADPFASVPLPLSQSQYN